MQELNLRAGEQGVQAGGGPRHGQNRPGQPDECSKLVTLMGISKDSMKIATAIALIFILLFNLQ